MFWLLVRDGTLESFLPGPAPHTAPRGATLTGNGLRVSRETGNSFRAGDCTVRTTSYIRGSPPTPSQLQIDQRYSA